MQDFTTRFAHLQLHVGRGQFLTHLGGSVAQLFRHTSHGGIETESGFNADDEQVESVRQLQKDFRLTRHFHQRQNQFRQVESDATTDDQSHP